MPETLGAAFASAVATKDRRRVGELLHPEIDFRAMTPGRVWEAPDPAGVQEVLDTWFSDDDEIVEVPALEVDSFADRERVGYRFRVRNPSGEHLVEQQAYLTARDGQIGWLRIMCSGNRPTSQPS